MRKFATALLVLVVISPALLADTATAKLMYHKKADTNSIMVTTSKVKLRGLSCHCTGQWKPTPMVKLVDMGTGELLSEPLQCSQGYANADRLKVSKNVAAGRHLSVLIHNNGNPSKQEKPGLTSCGIVPVSYNTCAVTVDYREKGKPW